CHMGYHQLTQEERYFISTRMRSGVSLRAIAKEMGRSTSTLSREVARNATRYDGAYRPSKAQVYALGRRRRCRRRSRYTASDWVWIDTLLWMKWSPEQIAKTLGLQGELSISHETIYRRIRRDRRQGGHLWLYTRIMSKFGKRPANTGLT